MKKDVLFKNWKKQNTRNNDQIITNNQSSIFNKKLFEKFGNWYLKFGVYLFLVSWSLSLSFIFVGCVHPQQPINRVCFKQICFEVELARTESQKEKGLQQRKSLDKNKGMLFIFYRSVQASFWMKDTFIPLDMLWMDEQRKIVHIAASVSPCLKDPCPIYKPSRDAAYVLEINAGLVEKYHIHVGDQAKIMVAREQ